MQQVWLMNSFLFNCRSNGDSRGDMPAATMFSKFKSGTATPQNPIDSNPIVQHFEIGKYTASAGPELVWKIHDGFKKSDGRVSIYSLLPSSLILASLCALIFCVCCLLFTSLCKRDCIKKRPLYNNNNKRRSEKKITPKSNETDVALTIQKGCVDHLDRKNLHEILPLLPL